MSSTRRRSQRLGLRVFGTPFGARALKKAFLAELRRAIGRLREAPERWPKFVHGTRRVVLHRFPFSLVYRVMADSVQVIALAHDKRRPGYWRWRQ